VKQPLLLTALAVVLLVAPVLLGLPDLPDGAIAAMLVGASLLGLLELWTDRDGWIRHIAPTLVAVPLLAWLFFLSTYDRPTDAPDIGDVAPDIEAVRVRDGATFRLAAQRGKGVLLVFFRGWW
jgi:hypothetical protein